MNSYRHRYRYRHRTNSPCNRDDREVLSRLLDHLLHCASDIILFHVFDNVASLVLYAIKELNSDIA